MPQVLFLFDLDGTLIDSAESISESANQARTIFGFPRADISYLQARVGLPAKFLFEDLTLSPEVSKSIVFQFRKILENDFDKSIKIFPGVLNFLEVAKSKKYSIAIATNKPTELAQRLISRSILANFIDLTIGTGQFPPKPQADMLLHCLNYFKPDDSFMIGDRKEDIIAARASGIKAIGISQGFYSKKDLISSGADLSFSSFVEMHNYFNQFVWSN